MDGINSNSINSFYAAQLSQAQKMFGTSGVSPKEQPQASVFGKDGALLSGAGLDKVPFAQACYGVFTPGGGCGGGGGEVVAKYGIFHPEPTMPEPLPTVKYGIFHPEPTKPEPMPTVKYGIFKPESPTPHPGGKIEDPGVSVCMYGVFAPGGGGGVTPQQPQTPQMPQYPGMPQMPQYPGMPQMPQYPGMPQMPQYPGAGGTGQPIQPDMSAIMDMTRKSTESMRQMFGISSPASNFNNMAANANNQTNDYQSAVALTKLAQSGGLDLNDLRAKFENGELSGMTGQIAEQLLNGTFPGMMPPQQ